MKTKTPQLCHVRSTNINMMDDDTITVILKQNSETCMDENDRSAHETSAVAAPLCQEPGDKWTKRDLMLLALNILVKFGDGVEIYLPGVITQIVSCQMKLTSLQEGILAITLFVTMGTTVFVTAFLTDR